MLLAPIVKLTNAVRDSLKPQPATQSLRQNVPNHEIQLDRFYPNR